MALENISNNIWVLQGDPIYFFTFPYEIRSTVIEVSAGEYLIHSPVQVKHAKQLESLPGKIKYIVSPNKLHSLFLEDWQKAYPDALIYAPPGLRKKRPKVDFYKDLEDSAEPQWRDVISQKIIRGSWFMSEVVFFHKPSASLILGDLIENHNPKILGPLFRAVAAAVGMLAPHGTTAKVFRWTFLRRRETRQDIQQMLSWHAKRVIVNHGPIVESEAEAFLQHAFNWVW